MHFKWNLQEKSVKFDHFVVLFPYSAGVLHIFIILFPYILIYNLLGPGISFYRKPKINIKRKPNYEIGWFHN